jgi:hypothetical protein
MSKHDEATIAFTTQLFRKAEKYAPNADVFTVARDLPPIARRIHRVHERQCNGYQTFDHREDEAAVKRDEKREASLILKAQSLADQIGAYLYVQGDPRGWPLHLVWMRDLEPGQSPDNCYSSKGVGVPI